MKGYEIYYQNVATILEKAINGQKEKIEEVAQTIAQSVMNGGVIHIFGSGHSHMLAEEAFFRAGGLAPVNAILEPDLMLHEGADKSSWLEKQEGLAEVILNQYDLQPGETIIIVSNSGRNAVPIEVAMVARKKGLKVVAITSLAYGNEQSRHSSGKLLWEVADYILDNCGVYGDAVVEMPEQNLKIGPTSTVVGATLINALMVQVAFEMKKSGYTPPVIVSVNIETKQSALNNQWLIERYRQRIRLF